MVVRKVGMFSLESRMHSSQGGEVSRRSHKRSDAEFRKELINADMGVFNKIAKRLKGLRKSRAAK